MKYAMIIADREIRKRGLAARGLIRYHDEEQWEASRREVAEEVGKIGTLSITHAGRVLGIKVPLKGEYKIGTSWADTH